MASPPPLSARVTVVITTSPVPSNPSTAMLSEVIASFVCAEGLADCRKIVVCDKPLVSESKKKKTGRCTPDEAARYDDFILNLKSNASTSGHALHGCRIAAG